MGVKRFERPVQLEAGCGIEGFSSGNSIVDSWAAQHSASARTLGNAVVYVSFCEGSVAGFYTLSAYTITRKDVAGGWFARNAPLQVPAVLLGMLGVDKRFQHQGLGAMLLHDAILNAQKVAEIAGARALIVNPADTSAQSFYEHFGFTVLPGPGCMALRLR